VRDPEEYVLLVILRLYFILCGIPTDVVNLTLTFIYAMLPIFILDYSLFKLHKFWQDVGFVAKGLFTP